ncbi:ABC transporter permease [Microlunatus speluncae]|uniref:ABC transporter permease n=1 Tax=Microlunatus speluncae TaxID=2594267 RepID=UPI001FE89BF5|nr:ABC transporter permease [Microlunatus speluncae]
MSAPGVLSLSKDNPSTGSGNGIPRRRRLPRLLLSRPATVISLVFLTLLVLMAIFAPLLTAISGQDPYRFDETAIDPNLGGLPIGPLGGIGPEHWFGVEPLNGRDLFARIAYGARFSLSIAVLATIVTTAIGVLLGTLAGYFGGLVDQVIGRVMDFLMAFPSLIFMIAILSAVPEANRMLMLIIVLSLFGWPQLGRVVRSQAMSVRQREFVEAAVASGAGRARIIFAEVIPNLSGTIIVIATLMLPQFIATEAGLSFLGVGVRPPDPSWGQMISAAVQWYQTNPMFFAIPGLFLTCTVLSCMVVGDHVQRIFARREGV